MPKFKPPGQCPVCHEFVPRGALACPDCGACGKSGWNLGSSSKELLDYPEDDFDYDEFVAREFGHSSKPTRAATLHPLWWWAAILLLLAFLVGALAALRQG